MWKTFPRGTLARISEGRTLGCPREDRETRDFKGRGHSSTKRMDIIKTEGTNVTSLDIPESASDFRQGQRYCFPGSRSAAHTCPNARTTTTTTTTTSPIVRFRIERNSPIVTFIRIRSNKNDRSFRNRRRDSVNRNVSLA